MTTKERLHQLVDTLNDRQAEHALWLLGAEFGTRSGAQTRVEVDEEGEAEIAVLPEGWGMTLTGEPMPDVAVAVRRSRATH
jgi:hypothetical protein